MPPAVIIDGVLREKRQQNGAPVFRFEAIESDEHTQAVPVDGPLALISQVFSENSPCIAATGG